MEYKEITNQFKKKKRYNIKKQKYFIDDNGIEYRVDGRHVVMKPTEREKEVANILGILYGGQINIIPRVNEPSKIKTPDYIINNEKFDLKVITGKGKYVIEGNLKGKEKQANNFVLDITNSRMNYQEVERQIKNIYGSKRYLWIDKIIVIRNNNIIKIYSR